MRFDEKKTLDFRPLTSGTWVWSDVDAVADTCRKCACNKYPENDALRLVMIIHLTVTFHAQIKCKLNVMV